MKDDVHEGNRGERKGQSTSQSTSEMGASSGGEERNHTKTVMEVVGGVTESVGEDWVDSENRAENHGTGDMDKGNRDSCSLFLGVQNSCLHEGIELAPTTHEEHVQSIDDGVGLSNIKKPSTWTRLVWMDVGPVRMLKEGAKSILGKRHKLVVLADGELPIQLQGFWLIYI